MDFTELDAVIAASPGADLDKALFEEFKSNLDLTTLSVYADNATAIADGKTYGDLYRKSDGTLMVVFNLA